MFPEHPTCFPFAGQMACFKPSHSWNVPPSSSESVYPEITAQPPSLPPWRYRTDLVVIIKLCDLYSPSAWLLVLFTYCIDVKFAFSLSKQKQWLYVVTFSCIASLFLGYTTPQRKQEPRLWRGQEILTFWYCFSVIPPRQKNDRNINSDREGGAGTDCIALCQPIRLNVTYTLLYHLTIYTSL